MHTFEHEMFGTLRTVEIDGKPCFLLTDPAKALGYRDSEKAVRVLRDSQFNTLSRGIASELGFSGGRLPTVVTEGGLYRLIMRSNSPKADAFQDWVTDEILPALRRKGSYDMGTDDAPAWARDLAAQVNALIVPARAHAEVHETSGGYSLAETARRMGRGHHELTELLRSAGVLDHRCAPTEFGVSSGLVARRKKTAVVPEDSYERLRGFVMRRPV